MKTRAAVTAICVALVSLLASSAYVGAQDPIHVLFDGLCRVPLGMREAYVLELTGISGLEHVTVEELSALFPEELEGRPRYGLALGLREPGLVISFPEPVQARMTLFGYVPGIAVTPPELLQQQSVELTTVVMTWDPQLARSSFGWTTFGPGCSFEIHTDRSLAALGTATLNLIGLYGDPGDTIRLWGTEVGLPDMLLEEWRPSRVPPAVEPSTWGEVKGVFR